MANQTDSNYATDYERIFRTMYNQLMSAGQSQPEAHRIATQQATATVRILQQKAQA
jgi:hypothetical protein